MTLGGGISEGVVMLSNAHNRDEPAEVWLLLGRFVPRAQRGVEGAKGAADARIDNEKSGRADLPLTSNKLKE